MATPVRVVVMVVMAKRSSSTLVEGGLLAVSQSWFHLVKSATLKLNGQESFGKEHVATAY